MKTKSFLLAAAVAAMAFTFFACSGDDTDDGGGGGGLNLSDLPKEVYLVDYKENVLLSKEKYNGNGNIIMLFSKYASWGCSDSPSSDEGPGETHCECEDYDGVVSPCREEDMYDTLQAGNIQNGQIVLNLPKNIDGKYLKKPEWNLECKKESCTINVVPSNLMFRNIETKVIIPDRSGCYLDSYLMKPDEIIGQAWFMYASASGKVTGTRTKTSYTVNYNLNFSQGWNFAYDIEDSHTLTTSLPAGTALEWWIDCDN